MSRLRRAVYRVSEVLDYRTFVVATGFLALLLVGYLVVASLQQAHDATNSANRRGTAASRRIDLLNQQIERLQAAISQGQDERGQLAASVQALTEQVRRMGGSPIIVPQPGTTVIIRPSSSPAARPTPSPRVTPSPAPTRTATPSPTPSPSCTRLLGLPC